MIISKIYPSLYENSCIYLWSIHPSRKILTNILYNLEIDNLVASVKGHFVLTLSIELATYFALIAKVIYLYTSSLHIVI